MQLNCCRHGNSMILVATLMFCPFQNAEKYPPPWLIAMQRYGPPPSYPNLKVPGLNSPIPEVRGVGDRALHCLVYYCSCFFPSVGVTLTVVILLYDYYRYFTPLLPIVDLLSPCFFLLCLSQISLHTILPS